MARQRVITGLAVVLAFACVTNAGFAQTQATTVNGTQTSGGQDQSAAGLAQEATNPFATSWLMQVQQNNNWTEMPRGDDHTRVQSNLVFQPLMSLRLTEKQGLVIRPMVTFVNSIPHFDQSGQNDRTVGFGDTVLAFALPRSLLGGRLTVGAGPTFIFPTASKNLLSQDTWQVGPDAGASLLGKNFIAYAFVQQWFKVGGDGEDANHMNGTFNFTYMLANGFTIGTQPNLSVDWEAPEDKRVAFSIGPQIGKLCRCARPADVVPVAGSALRRSSGRRRPEVEHSAASDSDDSGPHQESALLTRGSWCCPTRGVVMADRCAGSERAHGVSGCGGRRQDGGDRRLNTPSLLLSTNQATALKPRVYPLGADQPEAAIGLSERVDFHVGELDAPLAQGPEGFDRSLEKIRAELLVCQNLANDQLHGSLRHDLHAVGRLPCFRGAFSTSLPLRVGRATSLPPCDSQETRANRPVASVPAAFDPSEYTRACVSTCSGRWCDHHHPALVIAGPRGTETATTPATSLNGRREAPLTTLAL